MDLDEIFKPKKPAGIVIGESIATLSVGELEARLAAIDAERARIEAEIAARKLSRAAAEDVFKR